MTTIPCQDSIVQVNIELLPLSSKMISRQKTFWREMLSSSYKKESILILHLLESVNDFNQIIHLSSEDVRFQSWLNYIKNNYNYIIKMISHLEDFQFFGSEHWTHFANMYNAFAFFNEQQYNQVSHYIDMHSEFLVLKNFIDKVFYCKKQCPKVQDVFVYDSPYIIASIINDMKKKKENQYGIYKILLEDNISFLECDKNQIASYIKNKNGESFFYGKPNNKFESLLFANMK